LAKKGQSFKTYTTELKLKALELKKQGMTKRQIADKLGITDPDQIKVWARKYRTEGASGLMDRRGRKQKNAYCNQDRYVQSLEMENAILKKYFEILMKGEHQRHSK
jgi:transposase